MSHSCPNHIQVALLYDNADAIDLRALLGAFLGAEEAQHGHRYNVIEFSERAYFRCFGGRDIMVFVEKIDGPANRAAFGATLGSVFTNMITPDANALIDRHRAHVLINVHNGPMPPDPKIQSLLKELNMPEAGQSLPEYQERLRVLGALTKMATDISAPTLSHWTHSDMLLKPAPLGALMLDNGPSLLHIHPLPYRAPGTTQEQGVAGVTTHGAAFFIGREISVRPHTIPWIDNFEGALAFIRMAIAKNGYIIPDGDSFSDDANTICYRVHHDAEPIQNGPVTVPCYELELLLSTKHGFVAPDYISPEFTVDLDAPLRGDPDDPREDDKVMDEWTQKRRAAERAGAGFIVKVDPAARGPDGERVFGRRVAAQAKSEGALGWLKRRLLH